MFDIGFTELLLVGLVALLVVGPERLPRIARTAGLWLGKGRRFINSVKVDIEQELKADELKRILSEQKRSNPMHEIIEETRHSFDDIKKQTEAAVTPPKTSNKPPEGGATKSHDGPEQS